MIRNKYGKFLCIWEYGIDIGFPMPPDNLRLCEYYLYVFITYVYVLHQLKICVYIYVYRYIFLIIITYKS